MVFSVPLLSVKVTIGKEKEGASHASNVVSHPAFDSRDLAIFSMSVVSLFAMIVLIFLAYSRSR